MANASLDRRVQGALEFRCASCGQLFVLLSHQEKLGIAVVDAPAVDTPVLISNQGTLWCEIEADGAGLVAADTADGTVGLLERWSATSPDRRKQMGEQARPASKLASK
ncbi:MAG: glycosyltransferase [Panacagrimonas sp.]